MTNKSKGTATAGWRGEILREFTPGVARLTVVDDPDGLLAEAGTRSSLPSASHAAKLRPIGSHGVAARWDPRENSR